MKQSHTSRNYAKAFFAFVTIGLAGACADTTVAPSAAEEVAFTAPAGFSKRDGVESFRVSNGSGIVKRIGEHVIHIPAGAICDPTESTYGATEWDKPCKPLSGSISIKATALRNAQNQPYVDFQPALRFAPDKNVMLFLRNGRSTHATWLGVDYCDNQGICVDESINDPSLKPFRVGRTSLIGRRIKHFSGYVVTVGEPCNGTLTQEPDGTWMCNDEGLFRRSGYMVASGLDEQAPSEKGGDKVEKKKDDSQF
ncbi:MAG TPA: hypothetical protein VFO55_01895 [Gemmatimonadaceae bacterium]|nr:hypothetical protein [Gemmatimonadaceae bacterium]